MKSTDERVVTVGGIQVGEHSLAQGRYHHQSSSHQQSTPDKRPSTLMGESKSKGDSGQREVTPAREAQQNAGGSGDRGTRRPPYVGAWLPIHREVAGLCAHRE